MSRIETTEFANMSQRSLGCLYATGVNPENRPEADV